MKGERVKKKLSIVRWKHVGYESTAPVQQGVLAYLIPGDRRIKAIFLSPVVSKVWSPHSAVSVIRGSGSANPLYAMILQMRKHVICVRRGHRIKSSRQEFKQRRAE